MKGQQTRFVEVRVGNTDAGAVTPLGERICTNALCLNTGGGEPQVTRVGYCSGGPLPGRYLTVQRHLPKHLMDKPALVIAELEVVFYNV